MKYQVFLVVMTIYCGTVFPDNAYNEQTRTAYAWLHGTMDIEAPDNFLEHAAFEGHKYALHPPLSAAIMTPFVALWGMNANQVWPCVFLGAATAVAVYALVDSLWLTAFFAFGTSFWYEAVTGSTWSWPGVVGMLFTLLCLNEIFGQRRGWLIGLWAGLAFLGQYQYAFCVPVYAWMVWRLGCDESVTYSG